MAQLKYLDYVGLRHYDEKIKAFLAAADKADRDALEALIGALPAKVGDADVASVIDYIDKKTAGLDGELADVAKTGAAADVSLADEAGLYVATTVEGALEEIAKNEGLIASAVAGEAARAAGVEGTLTSLTTEAKGTLVAAINEVDANADAAQAAADAAQEAADNAQDDVDALAEYVGSAGEDGAKGSGLTGRIEDLEAALGEDGSVAEQIEAAIDLLDKDDTAVDHQFVTAVSETNGVITVSRAALTADDIPTLTLDKITDAGTAAAADVATVAIGAEGEDTAALPTVAQVKAYVSGLDGDMGARVEALENTHATKTVGEGDAAHTEYLTVAEEAAAAVAEVVAEAPEAFDTLKEIADWIQKDGETGFDAAQRITDLEAAVAVDTLVVGDGKTATVQNAIDKAVVDEATRIDAIVGTPDTGKTIQDEIDAVEAAVGVATVKGEDGAVTTQGTGLTKRIEDLEAVNAAADTYVAITENEIDALFAPAAEDENA